MQQYLHLCSLQLVYPFCLETFHNWTTQHSALNGTHVHSVTGSHQQGKSALLRAEDAVELEIGENKVLLLAKWCLPDCDEML